MRVFFGLEIPAERVVDIADWRDRELHCDGRPVPPRNFHITVAFLGHIEAGNLDALLRDTDESAAAGNVAPFTLTLDQVGYFQRPGIFWLGSSRTPAALESLAGSLRVVAANNGGKLERRSLQPHVTLFRRCTEPPPAPPSVPVIELQWRHFTLFESVQGRHNVHYQPIAHWSL